MLSKVTEFTEKIFRILFQIRQKNEYLPFNSFSGSKGRKITSPRKKNTVDKKIFSTLKW
jgi:hypothetical protein